jgi:cysteine desulfurase
MRSVYLDHNASSPLCPEARAAWLEALDSGAANASSQHAAGRLARQLVDRARERVAAALAIDEDEVLFTSGATEANNAVIAGWGRRALVASSIEHPSVLEPSAARAADGARVALAPVDACGRVDPRAVAELAQAERAELVAIQAANGEIGVVQDLAAVARELARIAPSARIAQVDRPPRFFSDCTQALGKLPVKLRGWRLDAASFSAHKVGGPPGVGVLYLRSGAELPAWQHGGGQERGLRGGTEAAPAIAAAAAAIEAAARAERERAQRWRLQTRAMWREILTHLPRWKLVGPPFDAEHERLPNTLNFVVPETDGKVLVTRLDLAGLAASSGSACASGSPEPSKVLLSLGFSRAEARSGLRLSAGWNTTDEDCKRAVEILLKLFSPSRATRDAT